MLVLSLSEIILDSFNTTSARTPNSEYSDAKDISSSILVTILIVVLCLLTIGIPLLIIRLSCGSGPNNRDDSDEDNVTQVVDLELEEGTVENKTENQQGNHDMLGKPDGQQTEAPATQKGFPNQSNNDSDTATQDGELQHEATMEHGLGNGEK